MRLSSRVRRCAGRVFFCAGWVLGAALADMRAQEPDVVHAMRLAREGAAAAEAENWPLYLEKMEAAVALRPDFPRMLVNLAAAQVANERQDDAIATLNKLIAMGLHSPIDKAPEFAALKPRKDFAELVKAMAANAHPKGKGDQAFSLREVTGLIEGIAWRQKTGDFFFGDVNGRAVWVKNKNDTLRRFTPEGDELLGVFGLAIDENAGTLWAATAAVPGMRGFASDQDGTAAIAEIDLGTGELRRVVPVVRREGDRQSHVLGDLTLASDGTVFATDSGGPTIWRLAPGGQALEAAVESNEFLSLQGIVLLNDGAAMVADHANGLLHVDLGSRAVQRLEPPPNTTLIGIDGLARSLTGEVFAIQNGLRPPRVLRITLANGGESIASVTVVESGHFTMAAPSLGCIADGDFYFIGNAGWTRFENTDGEPSSPRSVPVFRVRIDKPVKK